LYFPRKQVCQIAIFLQTTGDAMTRKIAIVNFKGGTGKSTTAISLAHGLALIGKRVLLVDCDPQSAVLKSLGGDPQKTMYDLFVGEASVEECICKGRSHLDVIFSDYTLHAAEGHPKVQISREGILKRRLRPVADYYDFVLCDCPPEPNIFNLNSIFFADELVLPVSLDYLSVAGIADLLEQLQSIEKRLEHRPRISLIVPTFFHARERKSHRYLQVLKKIFGDAVSDPIRKNVRLAEAVENGQTIFESFLDSYGAQDYGQLVERIVSLAETGIHDVREVQQTLRAELDLLRAPLSSLSEVNMDTNETEDGEEELISALLYEEENLITFHSL
jgi:chromosome partitioning protein